MSAAATLKQQFAEHVASERQNAEEEYRNCVRHAADGDGPGLEDLSALCQVVGRTPDDFLRDVEALEGRRDLASRLEDVNDLEQQVRDGLKGVQKEKEKLKAQEERLTAAEKKVGSLRTRIRRTRELQDKLIRSCTDPARLEALHEQDRVVKLLGEQRQNARDRLRSLNSEARDLTYGLENNGFRGVDKIQGARERLPEVMSEIPIVQKSLDEVEEQIEQALAEHHKRQLALAEVV